jgi:hypothetical protein
MPDAAATAASSATLEAAASAASSAASPLSTSLSTTVSAASMFDAGSLDQLHQLLTLGAIGDDVAMGLFAAAQSADTLVADQLGGGITPVTFAVTLAAGLVTSLSPCTLSVLPLTIGEGSWGGGAMSCRLTQGLG